MKSGHFDPQKFEDHYETTLQELLDKKRKGLPIEKAARQPAGNVVDLTDALKASLKAEMGADIEPDFEWERGRC